ncbi:ComEA family DNA-binding protein [Delftia acidovorans]|uniref:ComEA family DNA-binding protein n=1 Tax=Delftia acidovorans TaxID=80866 RepID=UPI0022ABBDEB|nr:helix-hairpin-helix domain-containing protein [Delftia acidovorans]WAT88512.1 helix-hairpin-helix domain-containing protein [Delftia acidovorans]
MTQKIEALRLLEESLKELESPKGSIYSAVQKISRAATLLGNEEIQIWCAIQHGDSRYISDLQEFLSYLKSEPDISSDEFKVNYRAFLKKLKEIGLKEEYHFTNEELNIKASESGGGYVSIGFVEEKYADLVRTKKGNDRTYYKNNLFNHLSYVRKKSHEFASNLFNQLKFTGTISNSFDILRTAIDDKLLDINPSLAEQLMLAFRSVSSEKNEEWSHALTTCRRLLEGLADQLRPVSNEPFKGRSLGQAQYVNRLWAFMDTAIESDTNRDLAKTHVDFLGAWLEKINKITNKGVHTEVKQLEAIKAVFHTYLSIADLLDYLDDSQKSITKPNINSATIDELEALLDINRTTAKEIIKTRVKHGNLDSAMLSKIPGIGPKTLEKAINVFSI